MLKQSLRLIFFFLLSAAIGIAITLAVDAFENIAVEKKIRMELEQEVRSAAGSFRDCAAASEPADVLRFLTAFSSSAMSGKVIAVDPLHDKKPDEKHFTHLFTYAVEGARLEYYVNNGYLSGQLAILDPPELVFGLFTTLAVFAGLIFYTENKKQALALQQQFDVKHEEIRKVLEEHEALALLGRMAATLAHELKTPIATISNLVQVLPDRFGDEKFTTRFVTLMNEELGRTQQLINNLLAYGKELEVGQGGWLSLSPLLAELARKNSLRLEPPAGVDVSGDLFYLSLLFDNLMRNSRIAGAGTIRVKVRADGNGHTTILLEDDGSGFPAGVEIGSLLDPFVTCHASGAGLGLYLANKIAAAHDGKISLYRLEHGAGVAISLPTERVVIHG